MISRPLTPPCIPLGTRRFLSFRKLFRSDFLPLFPIDRSDSSSCPFIRFLEKCFHVCKSDVISVRQTRDLLHLPSDSTSRWTPLVFGCILPTTWACSGLSPARARPWRANETCAAWCTTKRDEISFTPKTISYILAYFCFYMLHIFSICQSIGSTPCSFKNSFVLLKCLHPKNPRYAESGLG